MVCSNRNKKINRPEEVVRQKALSFLINSLQFPKDLIIVERMLSDLNTSGLSCPLKRRIDILCYANTKYGIKPLLLIECKVSKINQANKEQVEGYNLWVRAPYVALISQKDAWLGKYDKITQSYVYREGLPTFPDLLVSYE